MIIKNRIWLGIVLLFLFSSCDLLYFFGDFMADNANFSGLVEHVNMPDYDMNDNNLYYLISTNALVSMDIDTGIAETNILPYKFDYTYDFHVINKKVYIDNDGRYYTYDLLTSSAVTNGALWQPVFNIQGTDFWSIGRDFSDDYYVLKNGVLNETITIPYDPSANHSVNSLTIINAKPYIKFIDYMSGRFSRLVTEVTNVMLEVSAGNVFPGFVMGEDDLDLGNSRYSDGYYLVFRDYSRKIIELKTNITGSIIFEKRISSLDTETSIQFITPYLVVDDTVYNIKDGSSFKYFGSVMGINSQAGYLIVKKYQYSPYYIGELYDFWLIGQYYWN